jgi:hypothetical protein
MGCLGKLFLLLHWLIIADKIKHHLFYTISIRLSFLKNNLLFHSKITTIFQEKFTVTFHKNYINGI